MHLRILKMIATMQWLSRGFRVYQIRFRPGLCPRPFARGSGPDPAAGSLQRSSRSLTGLRGPTYKEKGKGGERREEG